MNIIILGMWFKFATIGIAKSSVSPNTFTLKQNQLFFAWKTKRSYWSIGAVTPTVPSLPYPNHKVIYRNKWDGNGLKRIVKGVAIKI